MEILLIAEAIAVAWMWASCLWVLGSLNRAAANRDCALRFYPFDLLCLFAILSLIFGTVYLGTRLEIVYWVPQCDICSTDFRYFTWTTSFVKNIFVCPIVLLFWWIYVKTSSRAGVCKIWHRCFILAIAVPVAMFGGLAVAILAARACVYFLNGEIFTGGWLLSAMIILIGILYGIGRFVRTIVATVTPQPTKAQESISTAAGEEESVTYPNISKRP